MKYAFVDLGDLPEDERNKIKSKFEWVHIYSWMDGSEEICVRCLENVNASLYQIDLSGCVRVTEVMSHCFIGHQDQTVETAFNKKYGN